MPLKPMTREQELVKKLRAAAYVTREDRIIQVIAGNQPYSHLTVEELLELLPDRRVAWLGEVGRYTATGESLWFEMEEIVANSTKNLRYDPMTDTITFNTREWQTRTIRLSRIFEVTIRIIPEREIRKAPNPAGRRRQLTRRVVL